MFVIKCKDLVETIPEDFPHPELIDSRWHPFIIGYATLEEAMKKVYSQLGMRATAKRRQPQRDYRIFRTEGRKLVLVIEIFHEEETV